MREVSPASEADVIDLWRIDTPLPDAHLSRVRQWLSDTEHARAAGYASETHRQRFIARRGMLRLVLSQYLQCAPGEVAFTYNPQGKPLPCPRKHAGRTLHFNLTHSRDVALLAVSQTTPVGIDVEAIDTRRDIQGIAQRFFHPQEYQTLRQMQPEHRTAFFFDTWACKEAVVKAHGGGIASGIQRVRITGFHPDTHHRYHIHETPDGKINAADTSSHWNIHAFSLNDDDGRQYAAAVAWHASSCQLAPAPIRLATRFLQT